MSRGILRNKITLNLMLFLLKIGVVKPRGRFSNLVTNNLEISLKKIKAASFPVSATLNVTNLCNYRCKFCEIHYFYDFAKKKSGKVYANNLTVDGLKEHDEWLKYVYNLELSGATGEPFINPYFVEIVRYLKNKYKRIMLTATTNGALIKMPDIEDLIDCGFDKLLFSVHGGDVATYSLLQNGDFNHVIKVIKTVIERRKSKNSRYPTVAINFAINKLNSASVYRLIDEFVGVDLDYIHIQHYYDGRNRLHVDYRPEEISYYYDPEVGNKLLDEVYAYAKEKHVHLYPEKPLYLPDLRKSVPSVSQQCTNTCAEPWRCLKIKGCVEENGAVYFGICNRMILYKMQVEEFYKNGGKFDDIWNHPVLQYLRQTVGQNPMCQFCQDPNTSILRCVNNETYALNRDRAVENFFENCARYSKEYPQLKGLEILQKNPYEYEN